MLRRFLQSLFPLPFLVFAACSGCPDPSPKDMSSAPDMSVAPDLAPVCIAQYGGCLAPKRCCEGLDCVGGLCARVGLD